MSADAIRILHLSDFHFTAQTEWDARPVLKDLTRAIRELVAKDLPPDLVAITGDVAQSGKAAEYQRAKTWITEGLLPVLPKDFSKSRLLIVPGNHDADRYAVKQTARATQDSLLTLKSQEAIANVLKDPKERNVLLRRHDAYLRFANRFRAPRARLKVPWWSSVFDFQGPKIHLAGLCSSWMSCSDMDQGRLLIGLWQLNTLLESQPADAAFRIVLVHHPWDHAAQFDAERIKQDIRRNVDLVLRGHLHAEQSATRYDPDAARLELTVGSAYEGSEGANAFQLIELLPTPRTVRVHYRVWNKSKWIPDNNAYERVRDGMAEFPLARRRAQKPKPQPAAPPGDPRQYLQRLRADTELIKIQGLEVGTGKAMLLPIDRLYIRLMTTSGGGRLREENCPSKKLPDERLKASEHGGSEPVDLRAALMHRCLVVVGDPGSGKSTFLRRMAFELCRRGLGEAVRELDAAWESVVRFLPFHIPLADMARHMAAAHERKVGPPNDDAPRWLAHFAATQCEGAGDCLDEAFFRAQLEGGRAIVLLDGLDEVPSGAERAVLNTLIEKAAAAFTKSRFVVTTRPAAFRGNVVLAGFEEARIAPLDEEAIEAFLKAWCSLLWGGNERAAGKHFADLRRPLRERAEIRQLARNPVMLTALAVVHWNEKRLPEQRADLYESIIGWLAKAREFKAGRPRPDRCVVLHQNLALAMQTHSKGRQTQVRRYWAAKALASSFRDADHDERIGKAQEFLLEEENDSGIVVRRGEHEIRFWHLTFQEYLAARALAARSESVPGAVLLRSAKLYQPEWREVVLLLAGVLHIQGIERVDSLVKSLLDQVGPKAALKDKARLAGLLSAILRDLSPVGYRSEDKRYRAILDDALAIFDAQRSKEIPITVAIDAAEAIGQAGDPRFADLRSPDLWVTIPAGTFWMGAQSKALKGRNPDPEAYGWESPVHEVELGEYRIGRYPLTVYQYRRFVEDGGYRRKDLWSAGGFEKWEVPDEWDEQPHHPNRPVTGVSWFEAMAYAAWAGCRLPTEAEWERAARGADGQRYPWGDGKPSASLLNYEGNVGCATPVGVYPRGASPDGVMDMAGNVWEWCGDWYGNYSKGRQMRPTGPQVGRGRVLRGGAWYNFARYCRSSSRRWYEPDDRDGNFGFRLAAGT